MKRPRRPALIFWIFLAIMGFSAAPTDAFDRFRHPDRLTYLPLVFSPMQAKRTVLSNGILLYALEDRELPLITVSLVIRTGSQYDPPGKEGLAELAATVLRTGGADDLSGDAVDEALENMAAALNVQVSMDSMIFSLSVPAKDASRAMSVLAKMLQKPRFEARKLALAKDLKIEDLRRIADDPQRLALRQFTRLLYGNDPRGRLSTSATVAGIGPEDLRGWHQRTVLPANVRLAVSGDLSDAELHRLAEDAFGFWDAKGRPVPPLPPPQGPSPSRMAYLVKDIPQSMVLAGQFAPSKLDPVYYAFELLDAAVGSGGFSARIFREIRTNRGLAYMTGSFYRPRTDFGVFAVYAATKTASTPETLSVLTGILTAVRNTGLTEAEISLAKRSLVNSFIFDFTSAARIVQREMLLDYAGLPRDFLASYVRRIEGVNMPDICNAARRLTPGRMAILIVGGEAGYEALKKHYPSLEKNTAP